MLSDLALGAVLRNARKEAGISQKDVKVILDNQVISRYEGGYISPSVSMLRAFAEVYKTKPAALIERADLLAEKVAVIEGDRNFTEDMLRALCKVTAE